MPQTPFPWFSGIIGRRLLDQSWCRILFRRHPVCVRVRCMYNQGAPWYNIVYILVQGTSIPVYIIYIHTGI